MARPTRWCPCAGKCACPAPRASPRRLPSNLEKSHDSFLGLQWTRLPPGEAPLKFVQRVQQLLAGGSGAPARAEPAPAKPGAPTVFLRSDRRIPDYELLRQIGSGSYGDVWLARGLTGAYRAVKIVWRDRFADAEPFEREFRGLKAKPKGSCVNS